MSVAELKNLARQVRSTLAKMPGWASTPDQAVPLSCVESMIAAYWGALRIDPAKPHDPDRDRFLVSTRYASEHYAVLAHRGFFPIEQLEQHASHASSGEHPSLDLPGIENASGSLGRGLSLGVGIARAGKIQKRSFRVFVQMGDEEFREDSLRDSAAMAATEGLDNLVAIIDHPKWPDVGQDNDILALQPIKEQWESLGWNAHDVDGHDIPALANVLAKVPDSSGKPIAVVAHTVVSQHPPVTDGGSNTPYPVGGIDEVGAA